MVKFIQTPFSDEGLIHLLERLTKSLAHLCLAGTKITHHSATLLINRTNLTHLDIRDTKITISRDFSRFNLLEWNNQFTCYPPGTRRSRQSRLRSWGSPKCFFFSSESGILLCEDKDILSRCRAILHFGCFLIMSQLSRVFTILLWSSTNMKEREGSPSLIGSGVSNWMLVRIHYPNNNISSTKNSRCFVRALLLSV